MNTGEKKRVVLVGLSLSPGYRHSLAPTYLKEYVDAQPALAAHAEIIVQQHLIDYSGKALPSLEALADSVLRAGPDVVGFSCYMWNVQAVLEACRLLKRRSPGLIIVLGGPEVAPRAMSLLSEIAAVDYVVCGEGEQTFSELLGRLCRGEAGAGLAGLAWREPSGPVKGPERPLLDDLDAIPSPFLRGQLQFQPMDGVVIETTRGCPFKCKFCDWQNGQPTRNFSVKRVLEEISRVLAQTDRVFFMFADADIFTELPRAKELLRGLREIGDRSQCRFHIQTYLPRLDEEAFKLVNSPAFYIGAGVQSTNPAALKTMSRFFDRRKVEDSLLRKRRWAPLAQVELQLIYGLPDDNPEDFHSSLNWALAQKPDSIQLLRSCILPGAEFGRNAQAYGVTSEPHPPYRALSTPAFSSAALARLDGFACSFRLLNNEFWINRTIDWLADTLSCDHLPLWRSLIEHLERAAPEIGLKEFYRDSLPHDIAFIRTAIHWRERIEARKLMPDLFKKVAEFSHQALENAGRAAEWPAYKRVTVDYLHGRLPTR